MVVAGPHRSLGQDECSWGYAFFYSSSLLLKSLMDTWNVSASLKDQMVKNPPAMREMQVRSLGQEVPLEKGMATHSSILAWRIPRTEEPGGLQSVGSQKSWL